MTTSTVEPTEQPRRLVAAANGDRDLKSLVFLVLLWGCLAFGIFSLAVLLFNTAMEGAGRLDAQLFTNYTSQLRPESAGARAAIFGSLLVMLTTAALSRNSPRGRTSSPSSSSSMCRISRLCRPSSTACWPPASRS